MKPKSVVLWQLVVLMALFSYAEPLVVHAQEKRSGDAHSSKSKESKTTTSRAQTELSRYRSAMLEKLEKVSYPPKCAKGKTAVVSFRLHKDGSISRLKVKMKSGLGLIDKSILKAVENAAPFKPLPADSPYPFLTAEYTFKDKLSKKINKRHWYYLQFLEMKDDLRSDAPLSLRKSTSAQAKAIDSTTGYLDKALASISKERASISIVGRALFDSELARLDKLSRAAALIEKAKAELSSESVSRNRLP